ncbi:MAG: hypothetical protein WB760_30850 [Xanthobacteraceae bacterium]
MPSPRVAWRPISSIEPDSSSVAMTVTSMRRAVSNDAEDAVDMRRRVSSAASFNVAPVVVSDPEASLMAATTSPIAPPKSAIASSMAPRRFSAACSAACRCSVIAFATSKLTTWEMTFAPSATRKAEKR